MLNCLFFCCHEKEKEQPNTVSLEDVIKLKEKSQENINNTTQGNNIIQNNIEENNNDDDNNNNNNESENKNFYQNGVLLNSNGIFINENNLYNNNSSSPPILTINNINNININLHRNSYSKEPTKILGKKDSESKDSIKLGQKTIISVDNSCDQNKYKSFISFSNLTIKYNNNNNIGGSSINFSDTEIMSSCEITLTGDIFFNKEIKLDRTGIKNPLITNTNRYKNKKKACEIKFGVSCNNVSNISSSSILGKNVDEKTTKKNSSKNINISSKNNKKISIKGNQKRKMQSISSLTSLNNSNNNKNVIDVALNLSFSKIQKKITEASIVNNNTENYVLFILKYDTSLDLFQLSSAQDTIPLELLLNYNYPLRFQQNYHILIGAIIMKIKVIKNDKNESILDVAISSEEENMENKEEKNEIIYRFNPFADKMPITIGRVNCDININNISVSKLHAQIDYIYDYDEYFITDCKSTNGTYLLLKHSLNSLYIKREHNLKFFESKFKIHYVNFDI
jgi:hypothetical protein